MKALKLFGKNDIRLVDADIPVFHENEILLKVDAAAVCGTDVRMWLNGYQGVDETHPLTLGHELAGTIEQVGSNVPFYKKGMQVAVAPNIGCGICDRCVAGASHLCDTFQAFGINLDGGFQKYVVIPERAIKQGNIMVLPSGLTAAEAALNEPLSCVYNGFLKCNVQLGDYALVVGAGPIGIFHAMLLKAAGAKVILHDRFENRLKEAAKIVEGILPYAGDDLAGFVQKQTNGRGLDVAVTANPSPEVQSAMPPLMNYGGRVLFFGGVPREKQPVPLDTNLIHYRELVVTGSTRQSIAHFRKTLELIAAKLLPVSKVITATYPIEEIVTAFEHAKTGKGLKNIIVFG